MNREIYALQLIDEETGEVLKDVTPITESRSVIHGDKKLSEVLDLQRDKIEEQSKSNLVLVTTMQKLLSEKIEELGMLAKKQAKQPANLWGGNINSGVYTGAELIGDYYYLKEDHQIKSVLITRDNDSSLWSDKPADGDTIYTHIWISAERDIDYVPELHYRNNEYVPEMTDKKIRRGMNHLVFEHNDINASELTIAFKTSLLKGVKMYDLVMVTKTKGYFDFIESKVQVDYQAELDFYKSQLEKLKLTQEVDLNLLLTL